MSKGVQHGLSLTSPQLSALSRAAIILPQDRYTIATQCIAMAERTVDFVRRELYDPAQGLYRSWRHGKGPVGQADDYAFLISGLIDLYQATGRESHLAFAIDLQLKMDELFWDNEDGGYFASAPDEHILLRLKDAQDGAEPSAASVALHNLQRLSIMASNHYEQWHRKAEEAYACNEAMLKRAPHAFATSVAALMDQQRGYKELIITGSPDSDFVRDLRSQIFTSSLPNKVILYIDPKNPPKELALHNPVIGDIVKTLKENEQPSLRLCQDFSCSLPVYTLDEAIEAISRQ